MSFSCLVLACCALVPSSSAPQDPVELGRLAVEQRQVAEQLRRLDSLLAILEQRDHEEGREDRAKLLAGARERLANAAEEGGDLATVVEAVAGELGSLHTGNALEGQVALISTLQQLLDFLVQSEREDRERAFDRALADRGQKLEEFASRQQQLLERTRLLEEQQKATQDSAAGAEKDPETGSEENPEADSEKDSEANPKQGNEKNEGDAAEEGRQEEARKRLAEEQAELAQEIKDFNQAQQQQLGRTPESSQQAEQKSKEAAEQLRQPGAEDQPPSESEDLQEAAKTQQEALDALEQAQQETAAQEQQNQQRKQREALLNVEQEASELLERHRAIDTDLRALKAASGSGPVARSARARLRQAANEEKELAQKAEDLLFTIERLGADAFPFYIKALSEDHRRLASRIAPPRYRLDLQTEALSTGLIAGWESLIEAIRIEQERLRKQMNSPPPSSGSQQDPEDKEDPLVGFAVELQLLKRMQQDVSDSLQRLQARQETFAKAGIALGQEDLSELELLLDRQAELQLQFESMVARLQDASNDQEAEDL